MLVSNSSSTLSAPQSTTARAHSTSSWTALKATHASASHSTHHVHHSSAAAVAAPSDRCVNVSTNAATWSAPPLSAHVGVCRRLNREFAANGVLFHACERGSRPTPVDIKSTSAVLSSFSFLRHGGFTRALSPVYGSQGAVLLPRDVRILCAWAVDAATVGRTRCGCGEGTPRGVLPPGHELRGCVEGRVPRGPLCSANPVDAGLCFEGTDFSRFVAEMTADDTSGVSRGAPNFTTTSAGGKCRARRLWYEVRALASWRSVAAFVTVDTASGIEMIHIDLDLLRIHRCTHEGLASLHPQHKTLPRATLSMSALINGSPTPFFCDTLETAMGTPAPLP